MRPAALVRLAWIALASSPLACSSESAPEAPPPQSPIQEVSYEVFPFVVQLDDAALVSLESSHDDGTLVFKDMPAALASVEKGTVILGGASPNAPYGLLRIVRDVDPQNGRLVLRTIGAPLQLAFRKLHVRASASIPSLTDPANEWQYPDLGPLAKGSGKGSEKIDFYLFDGDGDTSTTGDQVHVHGEIGGGLDYDVDVDMDWGKLDAVSKVADCAGKLVTFGLGGGKCELPEIKAHLYVTPSANAKVMFEGAAFQGYEKQYTLASVVPAPGIIQIGPLTFVVMVDVIARIEGRASSSFAVGASASVKATTGLEFGSLSGVSFKSPVPDFSFAPEATDVTLSGFAKVSVGPRLKFLVEGLAGPYAGLSATASVDADISRTPCYDVHAGADGEVGFVLTLPGVGNLIDEGKTFSIIDQSIASGACKQPPGASTLPPGGGPDASHLLNPTFTPWAHAYDSPIRDFPHQTEDLAWMDVARSIDGRWVVSGSGFDALTKLDESGAVVWSKQYLDPRTDPPHGPTPQPYLLTRTLPSVGAGLLVLGYPYAIFELGQSGGVQWAERFEPPGSILETGPNGWQSDQRKFMSAASDGKGGYFVAGSYQPTDADPARMWLLHLTGDGAVSWSTTYSNERFLYPSNLVALDGDIFVAGMDWDKTSSVRGMFLSRLGADGTVAWAKRFEGCSGIGYPGTGMQPFAAQRLANGDVLVAGAIDLARRGLLMEVKPDGQVSWASSPWGDDPLTDMAIHAVRELPTTGFVAAGHYHYHFEQERVFLAGFDVKGRAQWIKIYGQPSTEAGIPAEQKFPGIALTDDGAALLASYTTAPVPTQDDGLWVLLAAAKDGAITFAPGNAEVFDYPVATAECPLSPVNITFAAESFDIPAESFVPIVQDRLLQVTTQTP